MFGKSEPKPEPKKLTEWTPEEIIDRINKDWVRKEKVEWIDDVTYHCLSEIGVLQGELFRRGISH